MCLNEVFKEHSVLQKQCCHFCIVRFKDFSRTDLSRHR